MSVSDILGVLNLIEAAREKSRVDGNYAESIKEYEYILKFSLRLSSSPGIEEKLGKIYASMLYDIMTLYIDID